MPLTYEDLEPVVQALRLCKINSEWDHLETGEAVNVLAEFERTLRAKAETDPDIAKLVSEYIPADLHYKHGCLVTRFDVDEDEAIEEAKEIGYVAPDEEEDEG